MISHIKIGKNSSSHTYKIFRISEIRPIIISNSVYLLLFNNEWKKGIQENLLSSLNLTFSLTFAPKKKH